MIVRAVLVRAERDGEPDGEEERGCFTAAFTANFSDDDNKPRRR